MKNKERVARLAEEFQIEELQERLEFTTMTSGTSTSISSGSYAAGDVIENATESDVAQAKAATDPGDIIIEPGEDGAIRIKIVIWEF